MSALQPLPTVSTVEPKKYTLVAHVPSRLVLMDELPMPICPYEWRFVVKLLSMYLNVSLTVLTRVLKYWMRKEFKNISSVIFLSMDDF